MGDRSTDILIRIYEKAIKFFDGDSMKTLEWYMSKNPGLGVVSPNEMIRMGREEKLEKWIDEQLAMNEEI